MKKMWITQSLFSSPKRESKFIQMKDLKFLFRKRETDNFFQLLTYVLVQS